MGQSSSQITPSQILDPTHVSQHHNAQMEPPSKPSRKRDRPVEGEEDSTQHSKKRKHGRDSSSKDRKANRAVPQHLRGHSIKPQEVESVEQSQVTSAPDEEAINVSPPKKTKTKRSHEPQVEDDSVVNGDGSASAKKKRKKDKNADSEQRSQDEIRIAETPVEQSESYADAQHGAVDMQAAPGAEQEEVIDSAAASAVARSESRRKERKQKKEKKHKKDKQTSVTTVADPEAMKSKEERKAEKKRAKEERRESKRAKKREKKERKRKERKEAAELSEQGNDHDKLADHLSAIHSDGLPVSAVGDPGPKRTKKKNQTSSDAPPQRQKTSAQRQDTQDSSQEHPVAIQSPTPSEDDGQEDALNLQPDSNEEEPEQVQELLDSQLDLEADPKEAKPSKKERKAAKRKSEDPTTQLESSHRGPVNTGAMAQDDNTRPRAMQQFQTSERGTASGKWTQEEVDLADKIFHDYCKNNKISERELRLKTTAWSNVGPFKVKLYEAFPKRRLDIIRKHMQRRFSPYEKGPWNEEETQRLREAYAKYPEQWPQIAKDVERDAQSCRDHWRHQVMYEDSMNRGAWSIAEEAKLFKMVDEAVALIMESTDDAEVRKDKIKAESMINWAEIANKMDGKRNKKRCMEKWALLKRRSKRSKQEPVVSGPLATSQNAEQNLSRKHQYLEREYAKMRPGDIHDAIREIMYIINNVPAANRDYHDDSTFWSVVAQNRDKDSRFKTTSLLRKAFLGAMKACDSEKLRKAENYRMRVFHIVTRMMDLSRKGKIDLNERAYGMDKPKTKSLTPKKSRGPSLSEEIIKHSDDEDEAAILADPLSSGDEEADDEIIVAETQQEQVEGGEDSEGEEIVVARQSANTQDAESLRSTTPHLSPEEFQERCKKAGRKQHRAYLKGYGR